MSYSAFQGGGWVGGWGSFHQGGGVTEFLEEVAGVGGWVGGSIGRQRRKRGREEMLWGSGGWVGGWVGGWEGLPDAFHANVLLLLINAGAGSGQGGLVLGFQHHVDDLELLSAVFRGHNTVWVEVGGWERRRRFE